MFGIGLFGHNWMDPAYLNQLEYMQMFGPNIAAAAAAASGGGALPPTTGKHFIRSTEFDENISQ